MMASNFLQDIMTSFALSPGDFLNGYFGKRQPGLKNFVHLFLPLPTKSLVSIRRAVSHLKPNLYNLDLHRPGLKIKTKNSMRLEALNSSF